MTTDLIAQAEAVLDGVTEGPWHVGQGDRVPFVAGGGFARADLLGPEKDRLPNARFIAWARNNVPALIAAVRELEARLERLTKLDAEYGRVEEAIIFADPDFDGDSDHANCGDRLIASVERIKARAEAAEAKLAEVEKERDEANKAVEVWVRNCQASEATVATLQAQVEAMRGALEKIKTLDDQAECCGVGVQSGYSPPECCGQPLFGLDRARLIAHTSLAALTTENQTNG